jgi:hypothetical protein
MARQKSNGGKAWGRKAADIMAARKQKEKGARDNLFLS